MRDAESGALHRVAGALVVVGEALGPRAHLELPRGDLDPVPAARRRTDRGAGGRGLGPLAQWAQARLARRQDARDRHRLAHRLCVLQLVTEDQLAQHAVADAVPQERGGGALADLTQVLARRRRVQQLDLAAHRARRLEGVVQRREVRAQQLQSGLAVGQPQILVGRDVREVPDERAHDRRERALERRIVQMRNQRVGSFAEPPAERAGTRRRRSWARRWLGGPRGP